MLTKHEKETIINFNEGESIAYVFTYSKPWQQHLEERLGLKATKTNAFGGKEYEIDKRRIKMPRAIAKLSAKRKARLSKQLVEARKHRQVAPKRLKSISKSKKEKENR